MLDEFKRKPKKHFKMKTSLYTILILTLFLVCDCSDLDRINFLEIKTLPVQDVTLVSANLSGEIKGIDTAPADQHGFVWSTEIETPTFVINEGKVELGLLESDGIFSASINDLKNNQTYFVRSFALSESEEHYGETITFTTNDIQLKTDSLVYDKRRTATVYGSLKGINSTTRINQIGLVWSATNQEPIIEGASADAFMEIGEPSMDGVFSGEISDVENNTKYYYRTYAILDFGNEIIYGNTQTWDTDLVDIWTRKNDMPYEVAYGWGYVINGKGYITRNYNILEYDFTLDEWNSKSSFNATIPFDAASFSVGDNIYYITGRVDNVLTANFIRYNTVTDEWTVMPDFPGGPRFLGMAFSIGDTGYFGLGYSGDPGIDFIETDFWKYDEVNGWEQLTVTNPDFPGTIFYFDVGTYTDNERAYIVGDGNSGLVWVFDPDLNTWTRKNEFIGGTSKRMAGFHINDTLFLGGGLTQGQINTDGLFRYNLEEDSWTEMADLDGVPRRGAMAFSKGNKGYIIGGFIDGPPGVGKDIWEYTPIGN